MFADVNAKFAIEGLTKSLLYEVESFRIKWIKRAGVINQIWEFN